MEASKVTTDKRRAETGGSPVPSIEDRGDRIARRAYELWQARGCPPGDDLSDWLRAEHEIKGGAASDERR